MPTQEEFDALLESHNGLLNTYLANNTADQILFTALAIAQAGLSGDPKKYFDLLEKTAANLSAGIISDEKVPASLKRIVENRVKILTDTARTRYE